MSWRTVPLHKVASLESGFGFPRENQGDENQEFPFFRVSDMNIPGNEVFMENHSNTVSAATLKELGARAFPAGTVIFPKIGAAIATEKKRILTKPATYDNNVMGAVPKDAINPRFLYYWFLRLKLTDLANPGHVPSIRKSVMEGIPFPVVAPSEQSRIVDLLDEADRLRRLRREADAKAARILPVLFLKMFGDPATNPMGWSLASFANTFDDTTAGNEKLQSSQFLKAGKIAVVDQGQSQIAGYSDDVSIAYRGKLPAIVFGDHTRIFKFIDHPFVLGADGVRVLTPKPKVNPLFAFWHCKLLNIPSAGYSRHFKYLKEKSFICPDEALQNRFSDLTQTVMSQIAVLEKAAAKVEQIFSVLLDNAFSGQLTAKWREAHMKELLVEMEQQARALNLPMPKELEALP